MIASQRRTHGRLHRLLWPCLFGLFATALATRQPAPVNDPWPDALVARLTPSTPQRPASGNATAEAAQASRPKAALLGVREDLFGAFPARVLVRVDGTLELAPLRPIDRPELLLYWSALQSPADSSIGAKPDRLPSDALLLGRIAGTGTHHFRLPDEALRAGSSSGRLVLFSLGHQEIVATAAMSELASRGAP